MSILSCSYSTSRSQTDPRFFPLTSGSGHGEDRLFFDLEGVALFSPSCFRLLLRFGFSASWSSVKETRTMTTKYSTVKMFLESEVAEQNHICFRCEFKREARHYPRLRGWFTSEETCWLFRLLLGFFHVFVSFLPSSLLFACSLCSGDLRMFVDEQEN